MGILAGIVALLAGAFLVFTEVKDPTNVIGITFLVMGVAIIADWGYPRLRQ